MKGLYEHLLDYAASDYYPFHMPGHKRRLQSFENPFSFDITEIEGFDDLHHPEGILLKCMEEAAGLYGADRSYYLVNGSACGILAAIHASVSFGGRILMARNCHKSAYNGVFLKNLVPEYTYPQIMPDFGVFGGCSPSQIENMLTEYPDTEAVIVTSPTYEGIVSDIEAISRICHQHGCVLIVDEAHGAHFGFHRDFPESAVNKGADLVIQSLHKTLPSLTQTALLHVKGNRVSAEKLERYLSVFQSSSPSYVLMASMDSCIRYMGAEGRKAMEIYAERLHRLREKLRGMTGLKILDSQKRGTCDIFDMDISKIVVLASGDGRTGRQLYDYMLENYHIQAEMCTDSYVIFMTSLADTEEGFRRLEDALLQTDERWTFGKETGQPALTDQPVSEYDLGSPAMIVKPSEALEYPMEEVLLNESAGRAAGDYIYIYPPGIPLLVPGEQIGQQALNRMLCYKESGLKIRGLSDTQEKIKVLKDT